MVAVTTKFAKSDTVFILTDSAILKGSVLDVKVSFGISEPMYSVLITAKVPTPDAILSYQMDVKESLLISKDEAASKVEEFMARLHQKVMNLL